MPLLILSAATSNFSAALVLFATCFSMLSGVFGTRAVIFAGAVFFKASLQRFKYSGVIDVK